MKPINDETIKISVILPVYNVESYLEQCLDSICGQTLQEIEIICVDDGSTDKSPDILHSYEKKDRRIRVLTQENRYAGVARNQGMKFAKGKYLLFLDSDDFFAADMLEKMYLRAEIDRLDVTICRYDLYSDVSRKNIKTDFTRSNSFFPDDKIVFSGVEMKQSGIFQAVIGWAWDKLFLREFVIDCGYEFPDFRSSEDGFFVYMLMARAERIGMIEDKFVFHRIHNNSSLSNTRESDWENGFKMLKLIRDELIGQKLYQCYEKSFVGYAVEFQVWYVKTLYERDAFLNAYYYIREKTEPAFQLMSFRGKYLCSEDDLTLYRWILELKPEAFLLKLLRKTENIIQWSNKKGWIFPYHLIPKGTKLVIYGAGKVGLDYYQQLNHTGYCDEICLVDTNYDKIKYAGVNVQSPQIIRDIDFDYVLIAIQDREIQEEVKVWLAEFDVNDDKIVCI